MIFKRLDYQQISNHFNTQSQTKVAKNFHKTTTNPNENPSIRPT
ncbi:hypothetical protein [Algibacter pacificus]|nr:hypothetical protein [Algibacter pacificus]